MCFEDVDLFPKIDWGGGMISNFFIKYISPVL
jgi:hypothetical protein